MAPAQGAGVPAVTRLVGAVPNPFNPTTAIQYEIHQPVRVTVHVYDTQGRLVRTLVDRTQAAGHHDAVWDGRDNGGRASGSGVYFVRMQAGADSANSKIVLLK